MGNCAASSCHSHAQLIDVPQCADIATPGRTVIGWWSVTGALVEDRHQSRMWLTCAWRIILLTRASTSFPKHSPCLLNPYLNRRWRCQVPDGRTGGGEPPERAGAGVPGADSPAHRGQRVRAHHRGLRGLQEQDGPCHRRRAGLVHPGAVLLRCCMGLLLWRCSALV